MACPIAITCGDPSGVGPEIIARWMREHPEHHATLCLVGPKSWLSRCDAQWTQVVGPTDYCAKAGEPTLSGAAVARDALEEAAHGCRQGRYCGVVTAPVSKAWMQQVGFPYPGHTEFFADRWFGQPSMAFAGGKMRVILATWHIPLAEVPHHMNEATLHRAVKNAVFLVERLYASRFKMPDRSPRQPWNHGFYAASNPTSSFQRGLDPVGHSTKHSGGPRIGICGLNPHAGEGGVLGFEEQGILDPILDNLRETYPGVSKCLPADTLFWRHLQGEFDAVVALYHDQGLGPLKTVDFETTANLTLGLPFIRTSPAHGTAFDIAGKGLARSTSFDNAVKLAQHLAPSLK